MHCRRSLPLPSPFRSDEGPSPTLQLQQFFPLRSLARAIAASNPDLIVAGDDLATRRLHELYRRESQRSEKSET
jgi:hypothetical protein